MKPMNHTMTTSSPGLTDVAETPETIHAPITAVKMASAQVAFRQRGRKRVMADAFQSLGHAAYRRYGRGKDLPSNDCMGGGTL